MKIKGNVVKLMAGVVFALALCLMRPGTAAAIGENQGPIQFTKGATYVGNETCVSCHEEQAKDYKISTHGRQQLKGVDGVAEGCEICHGPGSVHAENGGGKGNAIINPRKDPRICFTCHTDKKMDFSLPSHHPVLEGKMSCADCHELHGTDAVPTATSMETQNEVCFKCHKDQRGPFVFEHPALKDGCTSCHKVHGSVTDKLLVARDANLCLRCHSDVLFPGAIGAGGGHTSNVQTGACWSGGCHTQPHGSNFAKDLRY